MITTITAVLCAAGAGFTAVPATSRRVEQRLRRLCVGPRAGGAASPHTSEPRMRRALAAVATATALAIAVGGPAGVLVGTTGGVALARAMARREPADVRARRIRMAADLPVALDVLAACLAAGTPWTDAVEAVGTAVGGPLGERLRTVAAHTRLGADPAGVWRELGLDPPLRPLARACVRALGSGTPVAADLARVAADQRRRRRVEALAKARAAGVHVTAPLGLCFLPAFLLLGVVPAVAGFVTTLPLS